MKKNPLSASVMKQAAVYWLTGMALIVMAGFSVPVFSAEVVDRIVAVVNDDIIRLSDLNKAVTPLEEQIRQKGMTPEKQQEAIFQIRQEMLNSIIDDKLADQEIKTAGIFVDEQEIDNAIEQVKKANFYSDEELRSALTASGISMSDYRNEIKKQMHRNQLVNQKVKSKIIITESDVAAYYKAHPEIFSVVKKYMIRNIMMPVDSGMDTATKQSVRAKMESVHQQLSAGEPFEKMAKTYSEAVNADDGGKLGLFAPDELAENIRTAVEPLKPGMFSPIVETDQGYQIFYVEKIEDAGGKEFSSVADEIRQKLYEEAVNKKFQSWIETLRKDADIKIIQ